LGSGLRRSIRGKVSQESDARGGGKRGYGEKKRGKKKKEGKVRDVGICANRPQAAGW